MTDEKICKWLLITSFKKSKNNFTILQENRIKQLSSKWHYNLKSTCQEMKFSYFLFCEFFHWIHIFKKKWWNAQAFVGWYNKKKWIRNLIKIFALLTAKISIATYFRNHFELRNNINFFDYYTVPYPKWLLMILKFI